MKKRIMHGLWHDRIFPTDHNYTATWQEVNRDAEMWLWPFSEAEKVLHETQPHLAAAYDAMPFVVGRAGMLRFAILQQHGGIYMDLDVECLKPFGDLFDSPLLLQVTAEPTPFIYDCIMGSAGPHHPFWNAFLRRPDVESIRTKNCLEAALLWGAAPILKVVTRGKFPYDVRPLVGEYVKHHAARTWAGKTM